MEKYISKTVKLDGFIAKEKNKLLKEMLATDNRYFFLVEENCKVLDDKIYQIFIDTYEKTGIEALMWPRKEMNSQVNYHDDKYIDYWSDFVPSFIFLTRNAVEIVGFMDEKMPENTWQDIEYAKRIGDAGLSTPFGMFASPKNIDQYFDIGKPPEGYKNLEKMHEALLYWEGKDGDDFPIEVKDEPKKFEMI